MQKSTIKFWGVINSVLFIFCCLLSIHNVAIHAQGPMFDRGDGYAVFPTPRPTTNPNVSKEAAIRKILEQLFGESQVIPTGVHTSPPQITNSPTQLPNQEISNNPTGPIPDPSASQEYLAERLTQSIHAACTTFGAGVIRRANNNCVDPTRNIIDQINNSLHGDTFIQEIKSSTASHDYVQCVSCTRAMAAVNNKPYSGRGNAKEHVGKSVWGYRYVPSGSNVQGIVPGSLFVVNSGPYGHIGFVSKVNLDTNGNLISFRAQECNYGKNGYFRHDLIWGAAQVTGFQVPL